MTSTGQLPAQQFVLTRRAMLRRSLAASAAGLVVGIPPAEARQTDAAVQKAVTNALNYLKREQRRQGYWEASGGQYRVAMTALAGMALLAEGSTTTTGRYATAIGRAVDYLLDVTQSNGLIGYRDDYRYTYGHGFSMLFLSQVFGEEEDAARRDAIRDTLTQAVKFSAFAQTRRGGWGYVSARDGNDFDEGSTCVTQVQGLRACRNAGIPVPKEIIDRANAYIEACTTSDGGVLYSIKRSGGGARPPITAAALACLFSAGEYEGANVEKMLKYCRDNVWPDNNAPQANFGHWHYAHYYYAQVIYRLGDEQWKPYLRLITAQILPQQSSSGAWKDGHIGTVYTTAINATILQLEKGYLPIYQR